MAQRQQQLDALQADIRKSQAIAQRLPQFRAEVGELETRLETLKNVLPEEKDIGDLLRRLQTLAVQSNLTIRGFKPAAAPVTKQLHAEFPSTSQLDGAYHNLGLFFDRVSKFPRIIHIGEHRPSRARTSRSRTRRSRPTAWRRRSSCSRSQKPPAAAAAEGRRRPAGRGRSREVRVPDDDVGGG